jgi:hypothetical protein
VTHLLEFSSTFLVPSSVLHVQRVDIHVSVNCDTIPSCRRIATLWTDLFASIFGVETCRLRTWLGCIGRPKDFFFVIPVYMQPVPEFSKLCKALCSGS